MEAMAFADSLENTATMADMFSSVGKAPFAAMYNAQAASSTQLNMQLSSRLKMM